MTNNPKKGKGATILWIREHSTHQGDECLIWPFHRLDPPNGYGTFGYLGKTYRAHRFMCELVNGSPPTPKHFACHSCGRGADACVNPRHLSWKTQSENELDKRQHGTQTKGWWGNRGKLTIEQVKEIRSLKGLATRRATAIQFQITSSTVREIQEGRTWRAYDRRSAERKRVMELLASGPMRAREIGRRAAINPSSGMIQKMARQGQLVRVSRGLYALASTGAIT